MDSLDQTAEKLVLKGFVVVSLTTLYYCMHCIFCLTNTKRVCIMLFSRSYVQLLLSLKSAILHLGIPFQEEAVYRQCIQ